MPLPPQPANPVIVPNLVQGVSRQAIETRRDTQCEAQRNCRNSGVDGCVARNGAEFVAAYPGLDLSGAYIREIARDNEDYVMAVSGGEVRVFDLADGTECTVTEVGGAYADGYLSAALGIEEDNIRAHTVEDTTFIANRLVEPAMAATTSPALAKEALIFVRSAAYSMKFTVKCTSGANVAELKETATPANKGTRTPRSDQPGQEMYATKTSEIARVIAVGADGSVPIDMQWYNGTAWLYITGINGQAGFSATRNGSVIKVWRADGADFTIEVDDENGGEFIYAIKDYAETSDRLPREAFDGFTVKVKGSSATRADDYWLRYDGASKTWKEVVAPSTPTSLNANTMPHVLVNTGYRTFDYKKATWSSRVAGDGVNTAKDPAFIGKSLRDVFWHGQRLAFLYETGCAWSKDKNPYTHFVDTVQTTLATAPIQTMLIPTKAGNRGGTRFVDFPVVANKTVMVWSRDAQFSLGAVQGEVLAEDTVTAEQASAYDYNPLMRPLNVGRMVLFSVDAGSYSTVMLAHLQDGSVVGETDISAHVANYVPSSLGGGTTEDTLREVFLIGRGANGGNIYVYDYLIGGSNSEFVQSAWNVWNIPGGDILWVSAKDHVLRILQQRNEGVVLLRVQLNPRLVDNIGTTTLPYRYRLDLRASEGDCTLTAIGTAEEPVTRIALPWLAVGGTYEPDILFIPLAWGGGAGEPVWDIQTFSAGAGSDGVLDVPGDWTHAGSRFLVGQRVVAERTESQFALRTDGGSIHTSNLVVGEFVLTASLTAYSWVEVTDKSGRSQTRRYAGSAPLDAVGRPVGTAKLTIRAGCGLPADTCQVRIINDSPYPSNWQTGAWHWVAAGGGLGT